MSTRGFVGLMIVGFAVVFWRSLPSGGGMPPPYRFVGIALVYTLLALLALASQGLATALAAAVLLALLLTGGGVPQVPVKPAGTS